MKLFLITVMVCFHLDTSQSQCTRETLTTTNVQSLIGSSLSATGGPAPQIDLLEFRLVCLASNTMLNTYRSASLVVRYNCMGGSSCPAGKTVTGSLQKKVI